MKSLKIIQTLAKVVRVICIILFILFIIGASGCLIALIVFPVIQNVIVEPGKTVADLLLENGVTLPNLYSALAIGLLSAGTGIFLTKYSEVFFKEEIELGTPFNMPLVKKMRTVAIVNIVVSIAVSILAAIIISIVSAVYQVKMKYDFSIVSTVSYGLCLLVISLFCEYGAEVENKSKEEKAEVLEEPKQE